MKRYYGEGCQRLIDRVAKIDCDAANYILHVAPVISRRLAKNDQSFLCPSNSLISSFTWRCTPQGYYYWAKLYLRIESALEDKL